MWLGSRRTVRRLAALALGAVACAAVLSGCNGDERVYRESVPNAGTSPSWAPRPAHAAGLSELAVADAHGFRVFTATGAKRFLPGINLGSTTPLHQPGELAISASDYRRWFAEMGNLGIRAVRIYTIHPPAFYDELARYNTAHPAAPLYLVQGVYLPDESYTEPGKTLYDHHLDTAFTAELRAASDAVHGDLTRSPQPGRASGTWHTDVSRWLVSWIIGVEWDPAGTRRTDRVEKAAPYTAGRYFRATADATPTERWIARHMDTLAAAEHAHGVSVPIAFANWPTADPLHHPDEPLRTEDLVGVDANHVLPTAAWPGGTFASFHAYPYYPDFLRHEKALARTSYDGKPDAYAGYLQALKRHFTSMPVLVTEFGVPSSLGSAHLGTNGRGQGDHTEPQAMAIDASLLRLIKAQGVGAGFLFAWTDEWFKRTWNTQDHQDPTRRQLWHDPLTNEQWFGVVATDSGRVPDAAHELTPATGPVSYVLADADASWVYLDITLRTGLPRTFTLTADTVPGPDAADYRVDVDLGARTAQAYVRAGLDPVRLDTLVADYQPDVGKPWHAYRLIINRELVLHGRRLPAEFLDVGKLREGTWDPKSPAYDSLATWQVVPGKDKDTPILRLRLPWSMLGMSDPSSRLALGEGEPATPVTIPGIRFGFAVDGTEAAPMDYTGPTWNHVTSTERLKSGIGPLAAAFRDTAR